MDNIFNVPTHADGLRMPALVAVDGELMPSPPFEALGAGVVDVPLIISTMAQEPGKAPANMFNASVLSPAKFVEQLSRYFDGFLGDGFGARLGALYANFTTRSAQLSFDSIAADIGVGCGNRELAAAATAGFSRSKVYSVVNAVGSGPFYAYHGRDLQSATTDKGEQGVRIRAWWREFGETGAVAAWRGANDGRAGEASGAAAIVTNVLTDSAVVQEEGYHEDVCALWRASGAGPEFWWSN